MHLAFALPEPAQSGLGGGAAYMRGLIDALRVEGHAPSLAIASNPVFPTGTVPVIDGMLLPAWHPHLDQLVAADAVVLIHHVAAAAGRQDGERERVQQIEAEMLPRLRRVIATSRPIADRLASEFGIAAKIVLPGARDLARSQPDETDPLLLSVGVLTRRKRHDHMLRTVARLIDLPWHLVIAGDAGREPAHEAELLALVDELGLGRRVTLRPDPDPLALDQAWGRATVFTLASRWEGYPTAAAEALRRGVPFVVTDVGDVGALIPNEAGVVVPLDDAATFGKSLRRLLCDDELRRDMADAAWTAGQALPTWRDRAREFIAILEQ